MLQHLIVKYGTHKSFVPRKIIELESLPKPKKNDFRVIVNNLNKIATNVKYITDHGEVDRLESSVIKGIIEQAFHEEQLHDHNKALLKFKKDCKADVLASDTANFSELNYSVYFDSAKMLKDRLGFLQTFIEGELEFCLQFGIWIFIV